MATNQMANFEEQVQQLQNQMNMLQMNFNMMFNYFYTQPQQMKMKMECTENVCEIQPKNDIPPKNEQSKKKGKKMKKTIFSASSTENSSSTIVAADTNEIVFRNKAGQEFFRTYNRLPRIVINNKSELLDYKNDYPNDFFANCFDGPMLIAHRDPETNAVLYSTRTWENALLQSWKKGSPTFGDYMTKIIPSIENSHIDDIEAVFKNDANVTVAVVQIVATGHFLAMEFSPDQQPGVYLIMTRYADGTSKTHIPTYTNVDQLLENINKNISVVHVDGNSHVPHAIYCSEMVFDREVFTYGARTQRDIVNNLFSLVRAMVSTRGRIENDRSYQFLSTIAYPNIDYVADVVYDYIIKIKPNFEKNPFSLNVPRFVFDFISEINVNLNLDQLKDNYYDGYDIYCQIVMELCARGANQQDAELIRNIIISETQNRNNWKSFTKEQIEKVISSNPKKFEELGKACRDLSRLFNKNNISNEIFKFTQRKAFAELTNSFYVFADVLNTV